MRPFVFERASDVGGAVYAATQPPAPGEGRAAFLAGGTTLIDLMKLDVMRPARVIDINALGGTSAGKIEAQDGGVRLGALVRMADAAEHPALRRDYPVVVQALERAASQQLRNMATLGGNVLQRTRCTYFRDVSYASCNKRMPGSGCAALDGVNRQHAVLGTSKNCIASYPGDFAQALIALDATVNVASAAGNRVIAFESLHRRPGETANVETALDPGDLITAFEIPARPWTRRSLYLKIRDRLSYAFALISVAAALELESGTIKEARLALGGVAHKPWRDTAAEAALRGQAANQASFTSAADLLLRDVKGYEHNTFKIDLARRGIVRTLTQAALGTPQSQSDKKIR